MPVTTGTQPSGTGIFSQPPIEVLVSVVGGYDDNVNTAPNGQGSAFTNGRLDVAYSFGNPRLQLNLDATAGGTYYYQHLANQNYDIDLHSSLTAKYKAAPRLTLGSDILVSYLTEPSFNYAVGTNYRNGNYFYTLDKLYAEFQWAQRFSTLTRYTITAINYDTASVGNFDDRVEHLFGNEFRFLLVPTTTLVGEYRFGIVDYTHAPLDSTTHFILGGLDHTFNPRLLATLRGGAEFRSYDHDGDRSGPYFEGNVTYVVGRRTSVTWTSRYGIEEPDIAGTQSRTTFRTGLQAKFSITPRLNTMTELYYDHSDYHSFSLGGSGSARPFTQDSIDSSVSLRYGITHYVWVAAGYRHTEVSSDISSFAYSRNHYFGGLNVIF